MKIGLIPELDFRVEEAAALPYAATPALQFRLRVDNRSPVSVRSIMLRVQVQIAAAQRTYNGREAAALQELFGRRSQWGDSVKRLLWAQLVVVVPAFEQSTVVELPLPCTYDFEVIAAKYLHAVEEGEIPLELLFSGTVFFDGMAGLQAAQLSWDKEAPFRLPVALWQETMDHYFPNGAWLRLDREMFDKLYRFKARHSLPSWEAALERLLAAGEEQEVA